MGDDGPSYIKDYNRGYHQPLGLPRSIGELQGQEARQIDDQRRVEPTHQDPQSLVATAAILGISALIIWGRAGGGVEFFEWVAIGLGMVLVSAAVGVVTVVVLALLAVIRTGPERQGSLGKAFILAAMTSLLFGTALFWLAYESIAFVVQNSGSTSGGWGYLAALVAGGAGLLIQVAALPLVHGIWETDALRLIQNIGGVGRWFMALFMLGVPAAACAFAMKRFCGLAVAIPLGIATQSGVAFIVMLMLSAALRML